ncbi:hypothetical protein Golax_024341 [Gossypium laxum]|uniref:DET1- and DDB1-associated protein 1 domain-containing protein n=1 Tax=Gossypium laxum TaxID=34288 RepID=A0A7J8ZBU9_9ROSI|nr:hypothetical protein [Gossypium laxum]
MHPNLSDILGAGQKPSFHSSPMGSMLGNLPSFDPHNFSQLRPSDPSNPSVSILVILFQPNSSFQNTSHMYFISGFYLNNLFILAKMVPSTYRPTHSRTLPPPDQGIERIFFLHVFTFETIDHFELKRDILGTSNFFSGNFLARLLSGILNVKLMFESRIIATEAKNILIRNIYQRTEEKVSSSRFSFF